MQSIKSSVARTSLPIVTMVVGILLGAGLTIGYSAWAERVTIPWQDARLFAEVFERVKGAYVDEVPDRQLAESAVRGMATALDSHSGYLDPQEYEALRMDTAGAYAGIGVEVSLAAGSIKIVGAIDDSPAARAGLLVGDVIIAVDNQPVDVEHLEESVQRMRGKAGTRVTLTIERPAHKSMQIALTRSTVRVQSVKQQQLEPGYGYVRIEQFSETTGSDFEAALKALQQDAKHPLQGLVLDLRSNPGGVLEAAAQVADAMLDGGVIVTADGRTDDARFALQSEPGDLLKGAPIAVLVNGGSASASEIVAGALKDHHRAMLIGQTTYGKGSVQTVMPLSDGGALKLTTSRYRTPSGASIQQRGIVPDVITTDVDAMTPAPTADAVALVRDDGEVRLALVTLKRQHTRNDSGAVK